MNRTAFDLNDPDLPLVERSADQADLQEAYSPRKWGPKYPPHDASAPAFDNRDVAALTVGSIMMLGPLVAYALGFGA